jgi:hypothetical protein
LVGGRHACQRAAADGGDDGPGGTGLERTDEHYDAKQPPLVVEVTPILVGSRSWRAELPAAGLSGSAVG